MDDRLVPDGPRKPCPEGHYWATKIRGGDPLAVRVCETCQAIDWDDLKEQVVQRDLVTAAANELARLRSQVAFAIRVTAVDYNEWQRGYRACANRVRDMTGVAPAPYEWQLGPTAGNV
jgi:hypothetical protein